MNDSKVKTLVLLLLGVAVLGALWYFRDELLPAGDEPATPALAPPAAEAPAPSGPVHPLGASDAAQPFSGELVPLPDLDDSDSYFRLALIDTFGAELGSVLVSEALIDKFVATVDNLPRKHVPEKIRPVGKLQGPFNVEATDDKEQFYLAADNYGRYDLLVGVLSRTDPAAIVASYRRFYPLLQESYVRLGYPDGYFNDRVVEVIDHLLLAPTPDEPLLLVQPHVLYEFADPQLEALSSGQKLMLRMGSTHAATIKRVLQDLRALITQPQAL